MARNGSGVDAARRDVAAMCVVGGLFGYCAVECALTDVRVGFAADRRIEICQEVAVRVTAGSSRLHGGRFAARGIELRSRTSGWPKPSLDWVPPRRGRVRLALTSRVCPALGSGCIANTANIVSRTNRRAPHLSPSPRPVVTDSVAAEPVLSCRGQNAGGNGGGAGSSIARDLRKSGRRPIDPGKPAMVRPGLCGCGCCRLRVGSRG